MSKSEASSLPIVAMAAASEIVAPVGKEMTWKRLVGLVEGVAGDREVHGLGDVPGAKVKVPGAPAVKSAAVDDPVLTVAVTVEMPDRVTAKVPGLDPASPSGTWTSPTERNVAGPRRPRRRWWLCLSYP